MTKHEEDTLIERLISLQTRHQAFTGVVKQYSEPLYWKIRRIILTHEDTNDILQNTFIKAWNNLDGFEKKSKLSTWLYRIAINESLDFLRRQKNISAVGGDEDVSVSQQLLADEFFDGNQAQALLNEAIATLPDVQRAVFNLKYFDEMKYSEMSKLLNTSEGSLKASYHIAVKKISEYLKFKN